MAVRKLKTRIQTISLLAMTIPLAILATVMLTFYYQSFKHHLIDENAHRTELYSLILSQNIQEVEDRLSTVTYTLGNEALADTFKPLIFKRLLQNVEWVKELIITDSEGIIHTVIPENPNLIGSNISDRPLIKSCLKNNKITWSSFKSTPFTNAPAAVVAAPFDKGIIIARLDVQNIGDLISSASNDHSIKIEVIDLEGYFITAPDLSTATDIKQEHANQILRKRLSYSPHSKLATLEKDGTLITGSPIADTGWMVVLYQDNDYIFSFVRQLGLVIVVISLIFIGAGVYLAIRTSSKFFFYFQRLIANIHNVADGIYKKDFPTEGFQELQDVEIDFYKMAQKIQSREQEIQQLNLSLQANLKEAQYAIADRKEAEKKLQDSHNTFTKVLDGIDATVYVADLNTYEILFMNKCMKDVYGADFTGQICWKVFRGEHAPCDLCTNAKLLDKDGHPTEGCVWHDQNPVTQKWYVNHDRAIKWMDGRYVRIQIATDISSLKQMERSLLHSQKMESLGNIAGGIAHDFNNILTPLVGYTELMMEDVEKDDTLYEPLLEVFNGAMRAKKLIRQILTISRQTHSVIEAIKIQNILSEVVQLSRATLPSTISMELNINDGCKSVMGDPTQIHQVVMNLIINASHAMEETGGTLTINLSEKTLKQHFLPDPILTLTPGNYIQLQVVDTGIGMADEIINTIFDPYFSTKEKGKGTGLGLSMVHGIITAMEGAITVRSKVGEGSTFTIFLPIADSLQVESEINPNKVDIATGNEHILIVDDEEIIVKMSQKMLTRLGYKATPFTSSIDALEEFKKNPSKYDLVITDMTMPNLTGSQLSEKINKINPEIPIIICTGFSKALPSKEDNDHGIKAILHKPVRKAEVARVVREVLDSGKLQES